MGKIYIFGYGSLVGTSGINGRNMRRNYKERDLTECHLVDYERSFNASVPGLFSESMQSWLLKPARFFGITRSLGKITNGVVFEINTRDIPAFIASEGGGDLYNFVTVTDNIVGFKKLKPDDVVVTCVTRFPSKQGFVTERYIDKCKNALQHRSEAFKKEFGTVESYL